MSYPGRSRQRRMACPLPLFGIVGRSRFYSESMLVSSRAPALPQRGVTDVTLLLAGIECRHIRRIERCALQIAFWKVRVRQERHAESDEIGLAVGDCRISEPRIVTAIGDDVWVKTLPSTGSARLSAGTAPAPDTGSVTCR